MGLRKKGGYSCGPGRGRFRGGGRGTNLGKREKRTHLSRKGAATSPQESEKGGFEGRKRGPYRGIYGK